MNDLGLDNCPFCNSDNVQLTGDEEVAYAVCNECGATGPIRNAESGFVERYTAGAQAVQVWNERTLVFVDHFGVEK